MNIMEALKAIQSATRKHEDGILYNDKQWNTLTKDDSQFMVCLVRR